MRIRELGLGRSRRLIYFEIIRPTRWSWRGRGIAKFKTSAVRVHVNNRAAQTKLKRNNNNLRQNYID